MATGAHDYGAAAPSERSLLVLRASVSGAGRAILAALAVFAIAMISRADLVLTYPDGVTGTLQAGAVIAMAIFAGLCSGILALLLHRLRRGADIYLSVSIIVLALSFSSPFAAATQESTALWISCIHLGIAAAIIPVTLRALRGPQRWR